MTTEQPFKFEIALLATLQNPRDIAQLLIDAIDSAMKDGNVRSVLRDPACRIIANDLALSFSATEMRHSERERLIKECASYGAEGEGFGV